MRWTALGVDYEMAGKDLIDSVIQSGKIARVLGAKPPEGFNYEMFLDENGEKISKSKGNGLSIEQWLTYGPEESLAYYIYREPKRAKSLHMGVIPRAVEDYWQPIAQRLGNAVHHVHNGAVPAETLPVSFGLLLNLVGVLGEGASEAQVWGYLANYVADADAATHPELARLIPYALAYHRDFVAPTLARRAPDEREAGALADLDATMPGPRRSRTRCMRQARPPGSSRCATGSRRCTKPCSDRARGRAWAASSRSTASPIRAA
jgi:lysyl-tRNA synthetase class 1